MKIRQIETFHCDAGWRPWTFIKITTDTGLVGWSECTDSHGSPLGIQGVVQELTPLLIGQDPRSYEKLYWQLYSRTRQSPGGIIQKAIGGIENALLDLTAKTLGIPVYALFGGPIRERIPLYWSHCVTTRVRAWQVTQTTQIKSLDDLKTFAHEIRASGYQAIKTNLAILDDAPFVYMPGFFKSRGGPELNLTREIALKIRSYIATLREAVGDEIDIIVDLNFNFKKEGYIQLGRMLEPYSLLWLELDTYDPDALAQIRQAVRIPICSGENLYGLRQYRPFFEKHAQDIASVDVIWNGFAQSKKIADMAELYEMNVTPHNYYSHLATHVSAHFCAIVPNFRMLEVDVDDVPWRDALVTHIPQIEQGVLQLESRPGWGADINEEVLRAHPWRPPT